MATKPHVQLTKRFGQHLLVDPGYLRKIIQAADLQSVDLVLEVGPGTGNLTELLVIEARKVLAVEVDARLWPALKSRFGDNFSLFEGDILTEGQINPEVTRLLPENWALVANLPYNVASPVMVEALYLKNPPRFMCVTIQKEVAKRLAAGPGSRTYGILSVLIQAVSDTKIITCIPPGAFLPPPKVDSAVVKIIHQSAKSEKIKSFSFFRNLVGEVFRHRRKNLRGGWVKRLPEQEQSIATKALETLKIDPTRRPETLSVEEFVALANECYPNAQ